MFRNILVPLDQSALAEQALGLASSIARASGATMDLAIVCPPFVPGVDAKSAAAMDAADNYLESIVEELKTGAEVTASHGVLRGDPAEMICTRAFDLDADLIVMTTHGRSGFSRVWHGSVSESVIRASALPVLLVRPKEKGGARSAAWPPMKQIVVPVDGSNLATEILPSAMKIAEANGSSIVLLQVVPPVPIVAMDATIGTMAPLPITDEPATQCVVDEAERHLAGLVRKLRDDGFANAEAHVVVSPNIWQAITEFVHGHHADLIAMSTHGRGMSRLIVGSVADKVRRSSNIPVLLRRPAVVSEELAFLTDKSVEQELPALAGR